MGVSRETRYGRTPGVGRLNASALRVEISDAVVAVVSRSPAKVIALRTGITPRAVFGLRQREHGPSAVNLILLARQYPELRAKLAELIQAETTLERDPARVALELAELLARRP